MACTGTPCARCWPTPCLRATGDRFRPEGPTLRQAQEEPYTGVIDRILEDDLARPRKQRHTAKRIFERLRDEYGFDGGYTTVKDYVREHRRQTREMFVPLYHAPGHAQCDFGEALVVIGGVERKAHCNEGNIRPGGGRGKRVTARVACETTEQAGFRGVVDVDLSGRAPPNKAYSAPGDLPFRPANWES